MCKNVNHWEEITGEQPYSSILQVISISGENESAGVVTR
jgi:hypothetical protein